MLLGAFAFNPPDQRCRTQSTRHRPARTVRLDDLDGDHNRWHLYDFDNSGGDSEESGQMAGLPAEAIELVVSDEQLAPVYIPLHSRYSRELGFSLQSRPPPAFSFAA